MEGDPDQARLIEISDYDPLWPLLFESQALAIRAALSDLACNVEHTGSTSVPGLEAKPVIDIHLTVADSAGEANYRPRLEAPGYQFLHRSPTWFEHRLFKGRNPEVNLHVFTHGCAEVDRCRLFRDWLRASPEDRAFYAEVKRGLAGRSWAHVQDYADAKGPVVAEIMARAKSWELAAYEPTTAPR